MLVAKDNPKSLGKVKFGKPHSFTFCLENTSSQTITIDKIVVGCNSCTKASLKQKVVPPYQSVLMDVIFTPGSLGNQKKFITVKWGGLINDLKLAFTAESYEH